MYIRYIIAVFLLVGLTRMGWADNTAPSPAFIPVASYNESELVWVEVLNEVFDSDDDDLFIEGFFEEPCYGTAWQVNEEVYAYNPDWQYSYDDFFSLLVCDDGSPSLCTPVYVYVYAADADEVLWDSDTSGGDDNCGCFNPPDNPDNWGDNPEDWWYYVVPVCSYEGEVYANACYAECEGVDDFYYCDDTEFVPNPIEEDLCGCWEELEFVENEEELMDYLTPVCNFEGEVFFNACFAECEGVSEYNICDDEEVPWWNDYGNIGWGGFNEGGFDWPGFPNGPGADFSGFPFWGGFPMVDELGNALLDEEGFPVIGVPIVDDFGNWVFDEDGMPVFDLIADEGPVWPGDLNNDGRVNHYDVLGVGMAFGASGPARNEASIGWNGQAAANWGMYMPNGVNFKYVDADGNGLVNDDDIDVINLNYGAQHDDADSLILSNTTELPEVYLEMPSEGFTTGQEVEIPIVVGDADNSIDSFYGVAFTIAYDNTNIVPASVGVWLENSWIGSTDELAFVVHDFPELGLVQVGVSRINNQTVNGFGEIGKMHFVMEEILAGKQETNEIQMNFTISAKRTLGGRTENVSVSSTENVVTVTGNTAVGELPQDKKNQVFPNPCTTQVYLTLPKKQTNLTMARVKINYLNGTLVKQKTYAINGNNELFAVDVSDLQAGLYLISLYDDKSNLIITEKVVVK